MRGDEVVARKRGPPLAFAARDKDDLALLIGEPIERLLDRNIGAPLSLASARVCKHVAPPFFGRRLLRVRPGTLLRLTSSKAKFGGMAVPAAQLDLGRPFQEKLSCPFDERRQIFVCEDGALVPEQISFKFHFRELVVGVDGIAESLMGTSKNSSRQVATNLTR